MSNNTQTKTISFLICRKINGRHNNVENLKYGRNNNIENLIYTFQGNTDEILEQLSNKLKHDNYIDPNKWLRYPEMIYSEEHRTLHLIITETNRTLDVYISTFCHGISAAYITPWHTEELDKFEAFWHVSVYKQHWLKCCTSAEPYTPDKTVLFDHDICDSVIKSAQELRMFSHPWKSEKIAADRLVIAWYTDKNQCIRDCVLYQRIEFGGFQND